MRWISPTYTYTPEGWKTGLAVAVDEDGLIADRGSLPAGVSPLNMDGLLVPGFVNAHCHLELSALQGIIPEGTGMAGFVSRLLAARRQTDESKAVAAIEEAMDAAYASGTVAIGDICNGPLTVAAKRARPELFTHSFIELLGLEPAKAGDIVEQGEALAREFSGLSHSLTLHAPYSASPDLRKRVREAQPGLLSLHLYESREEVMLFAGKGGALWRFLRTIPLSEPAAFPPGDPAHYLLDGMEAGRPMIWVHMAEVASERLAGLAARFPRAYACLCPRANQYIHRKLPDVAAFARIMPDRVCLGTDSLAGNHSLEMLEEVRTLQQRVPEIALHTLLRWATTGGAEALGIAEDFGSFTPGTRPGVLLLPQQNPDTLVAEKVIKIEG